MKIRNIPVYARVIIMLFAYIWTVQPGPDMIKVRNAAQAVNAVIEYLRRKKIQNTPDEDIKWQEQTLYSPGPQDFVVTSKLFKSDNWAIEVLQGVAPLSRTVYQVTVFNAEFHFYWQGSVKADGSVTELIAHKILSEEENAKIAEDLLKKSRVPAPKAGGYGH